MSRYTTGPEPRAGRAKKSIPAVRIRNGSVSAIRGRSRSRSSATARFLFGSRPASNADTPIRFPTRECRCRRVSNSANCGDSVDARRSTAGGTGILTLNIVSSRALIATRAICSWGSVFTAALQSEVETLQLSEASASGPDPESESANLLRVIG